MRRAPRAAIATVLAAALMLVGCTPSQDELVDDYTDRGDGNYVSGDGRLVTIAADDRSEPVAFESVTDAGEAVSSDDLLGQVVLVNFWYADCPPCRLEADELEELHQQFADAEVAFLGVNTRDGAARAQAFADEFGVTYPSVLDAETNDVMLAFAGNVSANAVPTTLVLDREGRVAARYSSYLDSPSLLADIIDDTLAEDPA